MSDLRYGDRIKFEKLFGMSSGYVMDFSNTTFKEFIFSVLEIDIFNGKYESFGSSKANHLRAFWKEESNYNVAVLNMALLEHWRYIEIDSATSFSNYAEIEYKIYKNCVEICNKLKDNTLNENINQLNIDPNDKNINLLIDEIKSIIEKNLPEQALDKLHTLTLRFVKKKAKKYKINYEDKSLNSIFGEYIKKLNEDNLIESEMALKILKSSISNLDAFNKVRNYKSFAHDNDLLKKHESILILNNILELIKFIDYLDPENKGKEEIKAGEF
jgi:hypothetical protein